MRIPDPLARGIRTLIQAGVLNALLALLVAFGIEITRQQQAAVLAFSVALGAFVAGFNAVEDATGKALLKQAPQPPQPVAGDGERGPLT